MSDKCQLSGYTDIDLLYKQNVHKNSMLAVAVPLFRPFNNKAPSVLMSKTSLVVS